MPQLRLDKTRKFDVIFKRGSKARYRQEYPVGSNRFVKFNCGGWPIIKGVAKIGQPEPKPEPIDLGDEDVSSLDTDESEDSAGDPAAPSSQEAEQPFVCSICGKGFPKKGLIVAHVRRMHPDVVDISSVITATVS